MNKINNAVLRTHHKLRPSWNEDRRELRLGEMLVKRFKWPAKNQILVLRAFEAMDWVRLIDNPFPVDDKVCPKVRLHDAIKYLNRHHEQAVLRFHGDGTGWGVCWNVVDENLNPQVQELRNDRTF